MMEEEIPNTSSPQQVHDLHARSMPGIQKDVDFIMEHLNDPNFDLSRLPSSISVVGELTKNYAGGNGNLEVDLDGSVLLYLSPFPSFLTYHSESPYPEVRAAVSSVDDPLMPVNTFRMWFLGVLLVFLTSGLNQVFGMRCMSLSHLALNIILYTSP
jgi:hypothetical protein